MPCQINKWSQLDHVKHLYIQCCPDIPLTRITRTNVLVFSHNIWPTSVFRIQVIILQNLIFPLLKFVAHLSKVSKQFTSIFRGNETEGWFPLLLSSMSGQPPWRWWLRLTSYGTGVSTLSRGNSGRLSVSFRLLQCLILVTSPPKSAMSRSRHWRSRGLLGIPDSWASCHGRQQA